MTDQATSGTGRSFFELLVKWLMSLPTDIKILIAMIGDDELDMWARSLAVGVLVYLVAPIDLIPDAIPVLGYVDDVLVLHIALAIILQIDPKRAEYYRAKYPQAIGAIEEEIELLSSALGALYSWLKAFVENLSKRRYKGRSTEQAASSEEVREEMFDEAMEYAAKVSTDETAIRQKLLAAPPNQLAKLLSDGLEEEQQRQAKADQQETPDRPHRLPAWAQKLLDRGNQT